MRNGIELEKVMQGSEASDMGISEENCPAPIRLKEIVVIVERTEIRMVWSVNVNA